MIVKTLIAITPELCQSKSCQKDDPYNQGCFEILGFDVLVDENMIPYLLEVNHNPSLNTSCAVDKKVKYNLVKDTLGILGCKPEVRDKLKQLKKKLEFDRVVLGKKVSTSEGTLKDESIKERDSHCLNNLGNFERVYPSTDQDLECPPYSLFLRKVKGYGVSFSRSQSYWNFSKPILVQEKALLFEKNSGFCNAIKSKNLEKKSENSPYLRRGDGMANKNKKIHKNYILRYRINQKKKIDLPSVRTQKTMRKKLAIPPFKQASKSVGKKNKKGLQKQLFNVLNPQMSLSSQRYSSKAFSRVQRKASKSVLPGLKPKPFLAGSIGLSKNKYGISSKRPATQNLRVPLSLTKSYAQN